MQMRLSVLSSLLEAKELTAEQPLTYSRMKLRRRASKSVDYTKQVIAKVNLLRLIAAVESQIEQIPRKKP